MVFIIDMTNAIEAHETESWQVRLQARGYRVTAPMRALIQILTHSERILGPLELFDLGRKAYPRMGLVTVYRTLEKLEEVGLVQRIHQTDNCHGYLRSAHGHEHILLCENCGRVEYFSGDDLGGLFAQVERKNRFKIKEHWLQLQGLCVNCQA
jgi:Fe2+ or Zn2+ uptake regulation protein